MTFRHSHALCQCLILLALCTALVHTIPKPVPEADSRSLSHYAVEVLVVVDSPAYSRWLDFQNETLSEGEREGAAVSAIQDYVRATLAAANLIWKGMEEHGVHLDLRIQDIRIVKDDAIVTPRADGKTAMNDDAFWNFFHWLVRNGLEYDHALLFTGLDLLSSHGNNPEGYAYMDTMCTVESLSLVEAVPNGIPAVVAAHEIAHSLDADHDGYRNNCSETSGYIMNNDNIGIAPQHWKFSSCSANKIRQKLQALRDSHDCVSLESATRLEPLESPYLGQLYSGDQLCQLTEGPHSYVCRHLYSAGSAEEEEEEEPPSHICQTLWCLVNSTYCSGIAPVDGTPCGQGKRCLAGQCLPFDDVPDHVTDDCYTGDMPQPVWGNQTCRDMVSGYTHWCLDQYYLDFCCHTCRSFHTGSDTCPYGDAHERCASYWCGTEWEGQCCETCPPQ